jgi:transposase InsO family protein
VLSRESAQAERPRGEVALKQWVKDYNEDFPHSALNYETPCDYERWFYASLSK